jgi:hypothetical protein
MNRNWVGGILGRSSCSPFILFWGNLIQNLP